MSSFTFETTPRIVCMQGGSERLREFVALFGARRVLVVTDRGLVQAGVVEPILAALRAGGSEAVLYSEVQADPPEEMVNSAVEFARSKGVDLVVGLGGGSAMDTAKLVALLTGSSQSLTEVYGVGLAMGPRLPLIQIPTTAGTGSEVTPIAIVTTPSHEKKGIVSSLLYPDIALLDSTLTLALPPAVTAMTGIDAIVHAIEAFTSRHKKNPLSDVFAVKAIQLLYGHIDQAVQDGRNPDVREQMLLGALMAGMAFANAPVAAVHALAYPLGGHYQLPHGLSNSLVLVPTLRFNLPHATDAYAALADAILPPQPQASRTTRAEQFVEAIAELVGRMPYAQRLRDAGISEDSLPMLARDAMNVQRLLVNNPRDVTLQDAFGIYQAAY